MRELQGTTVARAGAIGWLATISRYQWLVFIVAWLGWSLDAADFNLRKQKTRQPAR